MTKRKRVYVMKKILVLASTLGLVIELLCACGAKESVVGLWSCEFYGSEQVVEFTADGRFVDHSLLNLSVSSQDTENRYRIKGSNVEIYVEDDPSSTVELEYSVKDDVLTLGGVQYTRVAAETDDRKAENE